MRDHIKSSNPLISRPHLTIHKSSYFTALAFSIYFKYQCSLQVRRGNRDNIGIIAKFLHKNIFCDPSLEPSLRHNSTEG